MKTRKFKKGDICQTEFEIRIILAVLDDCYYFINYYPDEEGWYYNPTKSAFGHTVMEYKYQKTGSLTDNEMAILEEVLARANKHFRNGFIEVETLNKKLPEIINIVK